MPKGFYKTGARTHRAALARLRVLAPEIRRLVRRSRPADRLIREELNAGLLGLIVFEEIHLAYLHRAGRLRRPEVSPGAVARRVDELARRV